jgi:hypothetical protein
MLSSVEAWWASLCALPFDGAQGDSHLFGYYLLIMSIHGLLLSRGDLKVSQSAPMFIKSANTPAAVTSAPAPGPFTTSGRSLYLSVVKEMILSLPDSI